MRKIPIFLCLLLFFACNSSNSENSNKIQEKDNLPKVDVAANLKTLNISLPALKKPLANYVHTVRTDLKKVKRIVKVLGMVNATPDFTEHSQVINGFSDLMVAVFGERGKHARSAVGMSSLPKNLAVEIEMVVEVYD